MQRLSGLGGDPASSHVCGRESDNLCKEPSRNPATFIHRLLGSTLCVCAETGPIFRYVVGLLLCLSLHAQHAGEPDLRLRRRDHRWNPLAVLAVGLYSLSVWLSSVWCYLRRPVTAPRAPHMGLR